MISETNLYELHHRARLAIKPGITGMWQVSGRSDITDFEEVVRLDKEYITNWNIELDIGLADARNNYPIFRKGYTAAHPAVDFNEDGIGLVDMACFPGSSGSPIYILNEGSYRDKHGNSYLGSSRVMLLGVLWLL